MTAASSLLCTPIGYMRSGLVAKFAARYQPEHADATTTRTNYIELLDDDRLIRASRDLEGFERIWIVWWFDKNPNWRPLVRPPRGDGSRKGVFATRAPYRPNPIGITATTLLSIEGRALYVGDVDLIEGTAILDIKPYLPKADAFPSSAIGWLQDIEASEQLPAKFQVQIQDNAATQLAWLKDNFNIDFMPRAHEILSRDPRPHRTRRIVQVGTDSFRMGCGAWRIFFTLAPDVVSIRSIEKGYPDDLLQKEGYHDIPDRDAQIAFHEFFYPRPLS